MEAQKWRFLEDFPSQMRVMFRFHLSFQGSIYSSSGWPLGGVHGHHLAPSYHNIIFRHHLIIHLHPPYHQEKSHPSTHFMHPFHYHFSTPFFFTSFFSSKKNPHFIFYYHIIHHLNTPQRPLIEFRLVKNIDTLIS